MTQKAAGQTTRAVKAPTPVPQLMLQRACACGRHTPSGGECAECRKESEGTLQRSAAGPTPVPMEPRFGHDFSSVQRHSTDQQNGTASAGRVEAAALTSSGGTSLPDHLRETMEKRFGAGFSDVRIHADQSSGRAALDLSARAFTKGGDIYFAPGHYQPATNAGLGLIAHELTHVVQQRNGRLSASSARPAQTRSRLEQEAEHVERTVQSSVMPVAVQQAAEPGSTHCSPGVLDEVRALASGSIEVLADYALSHSDDALLPQLNSLRRRIGGVQRLLLSPDTVARMEAVYSGLRGMAPSWVPVPQISFAGAPTQQAGPLVIPIAAIALFILFLIVMLWVLQRSNPTLRRQQDKAVQDIVDKIKEGLTSPPPLEQPEKKPEPEQKPTGPTVGPLPQDNRPPQPYPLCWAVQLGPPTVSQFVRTKSERDEDEAKQARMQLEWRKLRDPDFNPRDFHVHHVNPLFLGGPDDLVGNGTTIPKGLHMKGHRVLQIQPQMIHPPSPLPPLDVNIYKHPVGTPYKLVGFKTEAEETCD